MSLEKSPLSAESFGSPEAISYEKQLENAQNHRDTAFAEAAAYQAVSSGSRSEAIENSLDAQTELVAATFRHEMKLAGLSEEQIESISAAALTQSQKSIQDAYQDIKARYEAGTLSAEKHQTKTPQQKGQNPFNTNADSESDNLSKAA